MDKKINQGEYVKNLILDISEKFENRLPCSSEEKNAAYAFSDQIKNETEVLPIVETFKTNPLSYIGIMPIIGYMGYFAVLCFYLTPVLSFIISIAILLLSLTHLVFSKGTFDFLFKKKKRRDLFTNYKFCPVYINWICNMSCLSCVDIFHNIPWILEIRCKGTWDLIHLETTSTGKR